MRGFDRMPALALTCLFAAGCYTLSPLEAPPVGTSVRARLTAEAAVRRSSGLEDPILHYDGVVLASTPDSVSLDVLVARSTSAFQPIELRDTVRLGATEIGSIMGRRLSASRSALFTVVTVAGAIAVIKGIDAVVGGTGDPGDNGEPPAALVPLFRWIGSHVEAVFWRPR